MPSHLSHRVNVTVTDEQHALLLELARIDPDTRSAAAFLRALLDRATPLLRKTVPLMRAAAEELDTNREELRGAVSQFLVELQQHDLLEPPRPGPGAPSGARAHGSKSRKSRGK